MIGTRARLLERFRLDEPLGRLAYAEIGGTLMAFTYLVAAAVIWLATGHLYQPLDLICPLLTARG